MNVLNLPWFCIQAEPGEQFCLTSRQVKHALLWTDANFIAEFLKDQEDLSLSVETLHNFALKDAYLCAAQLTGARRVLFNYKRGAHTAQTIDLKELMILLKEN